MVIHVAMPKNTVRDQFITPENEKALAALGTVIYNGGMGHYTAEEYTNALNGADIFITGWGCPKITPLAAQYGSLPRLVVHMGGTVAPYVESSLIGSALTVCSANAIFATSVAEGTLAYMLAALREIPYWNNIVQKGAWRGDAYNTRSLMHKKIGLVGFGAIAQQLIKLLKPFETEIYIFSSHMSSEACDELGCKKAQLNDIFAQCDIVSVHSSLTEKNAGMIGAQQLELLKNNAVFINTARAGLIDTNALEKELAKQRFTCLLDVFDEEPLSAESPLRGLDNVILIPHLAGPAADLFSYIGSEMIAEIGRFINSEPLRHNIEADRAAQMTAGG